MLGARHVHNRNTLHEITRALCYRLDASLLAAKWRQCSPERQVTRTYYNDNTSGGLPPGSPASVRDPWVGGFLTELKLRPYLNSRCGLHGHSTRRRLVRGHGPLAQRSTRSAVALATSDDAGTNPPSSTSTVAWKGSLGHPPAAGSSTASVAGAAGSLARRARRPTHSMASSRLLDIQLLPVQPSTSPASTPPTQQPRSYFTMPSTLPGYTVPSCRVARWHAYAHRACAPAVRRPCTRSSAAPVVCTYGRLVCT